MHSPTLTSCPVGFAINARIPCIMTCTTCTLYWRLQVLYSQCLIILRSSRCLFRVQFLAESCGVTANPSWCFQTDDVQTPLLIDCGYLAVGISVENRALYFSASTPPQPESTETRTKRARETLQMRHGFLLISSCHGRCRIGNVFQSVGTPSAGKRGHCHSGAACQRATVRGVGVRPGQLEGRAHHCTPPAPPLVGACQLKPQAPLTRQTQLPAGAQNMPDAPSAAGATLRLSYHSVGVHF